MLELKKYGKEIQISKVRFRSQGPPQQNPMTETPGEVIKNLMLNLKDLAITTDKKKQKSYDSKSVTIRDLVERNMRKYKPNRSLKHTFNDTSTYRYGGEYF